MLQWKDHLEENKDPLWDLWKVPNGIGRIIGLQFHSLPPSEQILFLDVSTFFGNCCFTSFLLWTCGAGGCVWLCKVHDETWSGMERRLQDLERSGMISLEFDEGVPHVGSFDIYQRFAEWFVTNHGVKRWKNAWCVFKTPGSTLNQDSMASDLVRLRMFDLTCTSARLLTSKMVQELYNLEVLQLYNCPYLTELNLEGLESLRHLELVMLEKLVAVTLTGSLDMVESGGIFESLQHVVLVYLDSLVHGPDVRLCTSLYWYYVEGCPSMTNLDEMECPHLKELELGGMNANQLKRLPNVSALYSLEVFYLHSNCYIALSDVEASRGIGLRDVGKPYLKVVEELVMYLHKEWIVDDFIPGSKMTIHWQKQFGDSENLRWHESNGCIHTWNKCKYSFYNPKH